MKIFRIIKAKLRNKNEIKDQFYHDRLSICETCPFNSKYAEPENKNLKYWVWRILNLNEYFCTICKCELKAKASEEMEECPKGKWKQITE